MLLNKLTLYILAPIIFCSLLLLSCNTGPDLDKYEDEELIPPKGENYELKKDQTVVLSWKDNSDFEEGYRIFKTLGNKAPELLAELSEDYQFYTDSTKELAFPTKYHVVAFYKNRSSDTLTIDIDFGEVSDFEVNLSENLNHLNLTWNHNVYLHDGFLLYKTTDLSEDTTLVSKLKSTSIGTTISTPEIGFYHEFFILPYKIFNSDTTTFEQKFTTKISTGLQITNIDASSYGKIDVAWRDFSNLADSYTLNLETETSPLSFNIDKNKSSFSIPYNFQDNEQLTVKVSSNNPSNYNIFDKQELTTSIASFNVDRIESISENELRIVVSEPSGIEREKNVFRKLDNTGFTKIGSIPIGENSFNDATIDPTNTYTYSISLSTEENGISPTVKYISGLNLIKEVESDLNPIYNPTNLAHSADKNLIAYSSRNDIDQLHVENYTQSNSIQSIDLPDLFLKLSFNKDATKVSAHDLANRHLQIVDLATESITTFPINNEEVIDAEFLSTENDLVCITRNNNDIYSLIKVNYQTSSIDTIEVFQPNISLYNIYMNTSKTKFVTSFTKDEEITYKFYDATNPEIQLYRIKTFPDNSFAPAFTEGLDSTIVMSPTNDKTIRIYDFNIQDYVFSHTFTKSIEASRPTFLSKGRLYFQEFVSAFTLDTKADPDYRVTNQIDFHPLLRGLGVFWNNNSNTIIDFRRSLPPTYHNSSYNILNLGSNWVEIGRDND